MTGRGIAGLVALGLALACSGDASSPGVDPALAGTYALQSIDGSPLPYLAEQQGSTTISITAATLTIVDGGTWTSRVEFLTVTGPQGSTQIGGDNGTWLRSGNSLNLFSTKNNKTAYTGTYVTNRLDLLVGSTPFVFVR